jgi:two-component system chemotaxis response regulator CheB
MDSKKIRVLVVDDSVVFREIIARGISAEPGIEVVATAKDPYEASEMIMKYEPDIMTCDVEMPKMNGIEFIRRLLPQYKIPIIVVSSINGAVFDAIHAGAVDFVRKPDANSVKGVENFIYEIIDKIKIASKSKVICKAVESASKEASVTRVDRSGLKRDYNSKQIIAIGASTGGTEAIYSILKTMPKNIPGIVIVQHIPPGFSRMFAERMNASTSLEVKEAASGDYVKPGRVLIAPGDRHMKIRKIGDQYKVECFEGVRVNGHCPSVDILFESVAKEAGSNAIGVILTGMGYDGAKGLLAMKRKGAKTIGQNEKSSVVYGMPKVAYNLGAVDKQCSLEHITPMILKMLSI